MVNKTKFLEAFGSIRQSAIKIGVSRRCIYDWIDKGDIPEKCTKGASLGKQWHKELAKLGFDGNLNPL